MSLNQLIQDKEKPWLNVRVNNLLVDGTTNIPGTDHYDSDNNSFQATNETSERPGESINIGGVIDDLGVNSNSVVLLGSTIGTKNIAIGTVGNVGNEVISIGTNLTTDGSKNIVLSHDLSINNHDNLVVLGNDLILSGIGANSIVIGDANIIRNNTNLQNQVIVGVANQLGGNAFNLSNKNTILGSGNIVNTTVDSSVDEETTCVGNSNNFNNCKNMVVVGDDNNASGAFRDGICVGKGLTIGADGEMVLGSGSITSVKVNNLRNSSSGDTVKYDSVSKELVYDTSGGGGGGGFNYSSGSLTITGTGNVSVSGLTFEPKKINFYYVRDTNNYLNVRYGTGTVNNNFTFYDSWFDNANVLASGAGVIPGGAVLYVQDDGTNKLLINIVSINSDGFTINTNDFTGWASVDPQIKYECMG